LAEFFCESCIGILSLGTPRKFFVISHAFCCFSVKKQGKSLHFAYFFCIFVVGKKQKLAQRHGLAAAAARYCHARRKTLPRPLQDIATSAASLMKPAHFPFSLSSFPLFP
jgi:hypothetical protein